MSKNEKTASKDQVQEKPVKILKQKEILEEIIL